MHLLKSKFANEFLGQLGNASNGSERTVSMRIPLADSLQFVRRILIKDLIIL
jgi:hypothetical protein